MSAVQKRIMSETIHQQRLDAMRKILRREGCDGYLLSNSDAFFSEYLPEHEKRVEWLTGFTGSAATVIVLDHKHPERSAFFTDGRYTLQAKQEVDESLYEIHNISECSPLEWLKKHAAGDSIGFDPWLASLSNLRQWRENARNLLWIEMPENTIEQLWEDRPAFNQVEAFEYPVSYAGAGRDEKIQHIADRLKEQDVYASLLTQPESINWLLNIRGSDIQYTPLFLCRGIITQDAQFYLYADDQLIPESVAENIKIYPAHVMRKHLKRWNLGAVSLQPSVTPVSLYNALHKSGAVIVEQQDPCTLPKALKNEVELEHIRQTHQTDGLALTRFLHWVDSTEETLSELSAAQKLESFRRLSPDFIEPSFTTISGFGPNGAIVHYAVSEASNRTFEEGSLYLVDSGGQYLGGTTDVTRTIAIGEPSEEMRVNYTRVLKGHIALALAVFPRGTNGNQLDSLARQPLWEAGLDYDHGTSHGVGCYMGVHEGPQGISKRSTGVPLQTGMILSNEPGYYKTDAYGIRIENLVETVKADLKGFRRFETLTCAPLDKRLVIAEMLSEAERKWWNDYHGWVLESHQDKLDDAQREWLKAACAPLG
jgi:Xaa-Pro aminopeptidase